VGFCVVGVGLLVTGVFGADVAEHAASINTRVAMAAIVINFFVIGGISFFCKFFTKGYLSVQMHDISHASASNLDTDVKGYGVPQSRLHGSMMPYFESDSHYDDLGLDETIFTLMVVSFSVLFLT